jgi:hypothetical protein
MVKDLFTFYLKQDPRPEWLFSGQLSMLVLELEPYEGTKPSMQVQVEFLFWTYDRVSVLSYLERKELMLVLLAVLC